MRHQGGIKVSRRPAPECNYRSLIPMANYAGATQKLWPKSSMPRTAILSGNLRTPGGEPRRSYYLSLLDHDVFGRHVLMEAAIAGRNRFDLVDHLAPLHD